MNDPYRISRDDTSRAAPPRSSRPPRPGGAVLRAVLWVVLMVSAVVNVIANNLGDGISPLGMGAGVVSVACIAALIIHHFRGRGA
ncbi:hypothetical protein [Sinosporangium siamense]|nr:hypothetical protein [Sinosporangium siamense]